MRGPRRGLAVRLHRGRRLLRGVLWFDLTVRPCFIRFAERGGRAAGGGGSSSPFDIVENIVGQVISC